MWTVRCSPLTWTASVLLASACIFGCKSEESSQPPTPVPPSQQLSMPAAAAAPAQSSSAVVPPSSKYDEGAFVIELTVPRAMKAGQSDKAVLTLVPKAPYHVNAEYPHRFKVASLVGATTPNPTVTRDMAKLSATNLQIEIPVVATQPGTVRLEGEAAVSVCTADKCLMEKRQLTVSTQVN